MKLNKEKEKNKQLKSYYKFSSEDKLIFIEIQSQEQDIVDFHIIVKDTELFSNVEKILYEYYPNYKNTKNYFLYDASQINKNKTIKENNIKDKSLIFIVIHLE